MRSSFCVTVYKSQGAEINAPYNIYDVNQMEKKQLYTALSRTKRLSFIHLDDDKLLSFYSERRKPNLERINSRSNSLYKDGKIYEVYFSDGSIYVGSTCEELETRLKWHKRCKKSKIYKHKRVSGLSPSIRLLVLAPSKERKSLENVENGYIEEYANKYGDKLLNVKDNRRKIKRKEVKYEVKMENKGELQRRIPLLEDKKKDQRQHDA